MASKPETDDNKLNPKIEILLYGLGAIGSFYAFILQRTPTVNLSVIARSNHDAVLSHGVHIKSDNHGDHHFRPAAVYRTPKDVPGDRIFDFVVCCNKAVDLEGTVVDLGEVIGKGGEGRTTVVLMQNGVGNEDFFHDRFPECTVLSGVVWVGATQESPGVVRQHLSESTTIGIFDNPHTPLSKQQGDLDRFTSLLRQGGTPFTVDAAIQTARWKKCIWNAAWNSLTTLSGVDVHRWLDSSTFAMDTTRRLMREAVDVATAIGVPGIEVGLVDELIERMQGMVGTVWTSMYHDSRAGRAMEVDVIVGSIVRKGREVGVAVPTLETLYSLLVVVGQRIEGDEKVM